MSTPTALFFDLDETLVHGRTTDSLVQACRAVALAEPGLEGDRLLNANSRVWTEYWPQMEEAWTLGSLSTAELTLEAWVRTLKACNCDDPGLAELARDTAWQCHCESLQLFDDVLPLLETLRGRIPCALLTNGASDLQREKLGRTGIERRFHPVVISAEHGMAKPDVAVFQAVLKALSVAEPGSAWHVGDSLRLDVGGAKAAGLTSVWLNRGGARRRPEDPQPDYEISSLGDLLPLLEAASPIR